MASDPRIDAVRALLTSALAMLGEPEPVTVTPTVQSDGYEFEVVAEPVETPGMHANPPCTHGHQKLVGNELRCAKCDTLLQVTGVIGKHPTAAQAEWAQKAAQGAPDGPSREGT